MDNWDPSMKTVLFICAENAGRSQIAEALFKKYAKGRFKAVSTGTVPSKRVNPLVVEVLKEIGIDISGRKPKLVTNEMIKKADKIITMGCGTAFCPTNFLPKVEDWALDDPKGKPIEEIRQIRDEIDGKVKALIQKLKDEKG